MSDVCLILEGTYPYITGGVSSCVHQLIEETPHLTYTIVYIGPKKDPNQEYKYPVPGNVRLIKELYLFDSFSENSTEPHEIGLTQEQITILEKSLLFKREESIHQLYTTFFDPNTRVCDPEKLFFSKESWDIVEKEYKNTFKNNESPSFIDFFYTWRFTNFPIFKILSMDLPKANIYHTMCTGYAGLLGVVAKEKYHKPLLLTEHGIYTHERKIEISQSQWLYSNNKEIKAKKKMSYFKDWWYQKFKVLGELTYNHSDKITTLYNGNKQKQIQLGAEEKRIEIIPNGINYKKLQYEEDDPNRNLYKKPDDTFIIGLVGRVVPIKDIKTFIKSIAYISKKIPNIEVLIMGPTDEDEEYFEECKTLIKLLDLKNFIKFTGKVNLKYYYEHLDIIVLSSISEGQPLVLLEAFAFGIPAVATDVGSCKELIYGTSSEDIALGSCGRTIPFGLSDLLGESIIELLENDELREQMGKVAKKRFLNFYQEKFTINKYLKLYNKYLMNR